MFPKLVTCNHVVTDDRFVVAALLLRYAPFSNDRKRRPADSQPDAARAGVAASVSNRGPI